MLKKLGLVFLVTLSPGNGKIVSSYCAFSFFFVLAAYLAVPKN